MSTIHNNDRMSRQAEILHVTTQNAVALIAGTGMLGSWTGLALARMLKSVAVWDNDKVELVNLGNQAFNSDHEGEPKTTALKAMCAGLPLVAFDGLFPMTEPADDLLSRIGSPRTENMKLIVVSGVDSIATRRELATWAKLNKADLFIDTRALGEIAVVACVLPKHLDAYIDVECSDAVAAAAPNMACGFNGTGYVGMNVAGRVGAYINAYFSGLPVPYFENVDVRLGFPLRRDMAPPAAAPEPAKAMVTVAASA